MKSGNLGRLSDLKRGARFYMRYENKKRLFKIVAIGKRHLIVREIETGFDVPLFGFRDLIVWQRGGDDYPSIAGVVGEGEQFTADSLVKEWAE